MSSPGPRLAEMLLETQSKELKGGSPSVHKLETSRHSEGTSVRQSLGTRKRIGLGETEKVFMLVGATGAGKTTLINYMANHILKVQWKDEFRFKVITEETKLSQTQSQALGITACTFYPMTGSAVKYTFTVIDTPGYGATGGLERDEEITKQIKEFFSRPPPCGIDHLNGVGFVVQSSEVRLTPTQLYIYDSILAIFGNDVSENIFLMITYADDQRPPVLKAIEEVPKLPSRSGKHFMFNSSALFAENVAKKSGATLRELFWNMAEDSFSDFFKEFLKTESVSLTLTKEVLEERERLLAVIEGLDDQITLSLDKREEIKQERLVLQQRQEEIETNKNFEYTVDISKPVEIKRKGRGRHTTTCSTCHTTCHINCKIVDDKSKRNCRVMNDRGNCTICPGRCKWSEHRNYPYRIKYETVPEKRTLQDLKRKYLEAHQKKAKSEAMLEKNKEELRAAQVQVIDMIKRAQQILSRLDEIALKPNSLTHEEYLGLLIESEKFKKERGWEHRVQYLVKAKRHAELLSQVQDEKKRQDLVERFVKDVDVTDETLEQL